MADLAIAIQDVFSIYNISIIVLGVIGGIIIGALPGLSSVMGLSILLPFTFGLPGLGGIMLLLGIFCGSIYGGSISAILINTPGTSAAAATCLDGYPMAVKKKQPGRALAIATFSSVFGGLFSAVCLSLFAPYLAKIALNFRAQEYFALALFGISIITSVSGKSIVKGLLGGCFGLLLATVGMDGMSATPRFTFGTVYLMAGISFVPLLIALFAFARGLETIEESRSAKQQKAAKIAIERILPERKDIRTILPTVVRSSVLGTLIGSIPGTGGDIASWVGYNEAKRWSKRKELFGTGIPEGIAASESANNAISGGALVPLLSLGIPGDAGTAVMLGAFLIQGIVPGPLLFTERASAAYTIFIGLFLANVFMAIFGFLGIKIFARVVNVPGKQLIPLIFSFCIVGTYALNSNLKDIIFMIIFGIVGYFLVKMDFAMPPIILGVVLGSISETNFRRAMSLSDFNPLSFFQRPISAIFIILAVVSLFYPVILEFLRKRKLNRQSR